MSTSLETKIKNNIIDDFNADLYRKLNITISDADDSFFFGGGYIYKIINLQAPGTALRRFRLVLSFSIFFTFFISFSFLFLLFLFLLLDWAAAELKWVISAFFYNFLPIFNLW